MYQRLDKVLNFPLVIGSIDDKHIRIECPKLSGILYHNYKGFVRMVLLAICDADYRFIHSLTSVVTEVTMTVVFWLTLL